MHQNSLREAGDVEELRCRFAVDRQPRGIIIGPHQRWAFSAIAQPLVTPITRRTRAAELRQRQHDAIAWDEADHTVADLLDDAGDLVPHDHG